MSGGEALIRRAGSEDVERILNLLRLGARPTHPLLRALFPEEDFVVWRAHAF